MRTLQLAIVTLLLTPFAVGQSKTETWHRQPDAAVRVDIKRDPETGKLRLAGSYQVAANGKVPVAFVPAWDLSWMIAPPFWNWRRIGTLTDGVEITPDEANKVGKPAGLAAALAKAEATPAKDLKPGKIFDPTEAAFDALRKSDKKKPSLFAKPGEIVKGDLFEEAKDFTSYKPPAAGANGFFLLRGGVRLTGADQRPFTLHPEGTACVFSSVYYEVSDGKYWPKSSLGPNDVTARFELSIAKNAGGNKPGEGYVRGSGGKVVARVNPRGAVHAKSNIPPRTVYLAFAIVKGPAVSGVGDEAAERGVDAPLELVAYHYTEKVTVAPGGRMPTQVVQELDCPPGRYWLICSIVDGDTLVNIGNRGTEGIVVASDVVPLVVTE